MMRLIPLTQNKFAMVDDEDYNYLNQFKWYWSRTCAARGIKINGNYTSLLMHRDLLKPNVKLQVDHIDGNGLNNQRSNLRICNNQQNSWNSRKNKLSNNRYKGVYYRPNKPKSYLFSLSITKNGEIIRYNKSFHTEREAVIAYNEKAKELFGEFANLNII
jgi:hypothetical protein